ncbi:hypothetical protein QBC45DRAFT_164363 [Copromyces sp. CBS 386.78]|nr:hypothetical protein QBC45DRAFT_164363 [Copromyces sp. CBS 386.78]
MKQSRSQSTGGALLCHVRSSLPHEIEHQKRHISEPIVFKDLRFDFRSFVNSPILPIFANAWLNMSPYRVGSPTPISANLGSNPSCGYVVALLGLLLFPAFLVFKVLSASHGLSPFTRITLMDEQSVVVWLSDYYSTFLTSFQKVPV